jgi:hypothetical protein
MYRDGTLKILNPLRGLVQFAMFTTVKEVNDQA